MNVQVLSPSHQRMELNNQGEPVKDSGNPTEVSKKRLLSSADSSDHSDGSSKENDSPQLKIQQSSPKRVSKRSRKTRNTPSKPKANQEPTTVATESLLSSISGSLSDDLRVQFANSDTAIQMLAAKMAEELAAKKLQELAKKEEAGSSPSKKAEIKEKARLEREANAKRKEQEKVRREEVRMKKEKERLEKKEQERLKKESDKLKREEEKLKKDEERRKREDEKRLKEEEKKKQALASERKQSRIANFFSVSKKDSIKPPPPVESSSDFDATFLPFYLRANVQLCEPASFTQSSDSLQKIQKDLDKLFISLSTGTPPDHASDVPIDDWLASRRVKRGYELKYTASDAVAASNSETSSEKDLVKILRQLPKRYIRFAENVRPPYVGTFTKSREGGIPRNNPFFKTGTGLNYDYDSEIEWVQEDEEGEDVDLDDDSDDNEEDDDDMDEFVSSDEGPAPRRLVVGPLDPNSLWNDGISHQETFKAMEIDLLSYEPMHSIDPFHDYWTTSSPQKQAVVKEDLRSLALANDKKKKRLIASTDMKPFLHKINGIDMNQIMLVETLKKEYVHFSHILKLNFI